MVQKELAMRQFRRRRMFNSLTMLAVESNQRLGSFGVTLRSKPCDLTGAV